MKFVAAIVLLAASFAAQADSPLADDVTLLREQVDRCRGILAKLTSLDDEEAGFFKTMTLGHLLEEVAAPQRAFGVEIDVDRQGEGPEPACRRSPGLLYGLSNLVDNALDFAVRKVVIERMIKRGVEPKAMDPQKVEEATHKTVRQKVKLKSGIDKDTAKTIQKAIKDLKLKVNASIQGDALRVTSSKKDELQAVIAHLKANPPGIPLQFNNYR